ncbi:MAG: inositol monophosphatase family protein [Pseudomonadota bacterium]
MNVEDPRLACALRAADAAEVIIRDSYRKGLAVRHKADLSPVTEADVACEKAIYSIIADAFPEHGFFGEETGRQGNQGSSSLWLIDPIDGTKSFVRGYPFLSTQIALAETDELVVGVSNAPLFEERAWAVAGQGAWLNGERLEVSTIGELSRATVSTGNLKSLAASDAWPALATLIGQTDRIRGYGDFYHYHLLAAGRIDVVVESDVNILDIAALQVVVEAAGGTMTELGGGPITVDSTSVLATNGLLHEEVCQLLAFSG